MPNHITNQITAPAEVIAEITRSDEKGDLRVDFAMVIPEPEGIEQGGCSGQHAPGVICWYEWNIKNWGTKWNAYSTEPLKSDGELGVLRFETAWSHPYPVIEALSKKFPEIRFEVSYADEDLGRNLGKYEIQNGRMNGLLNPMEDYSDEASEFAAQLKYGKTYAELSAEWDEA